MRIEAKIRSEMPLPMPRLVISSPIHIRSVVPAVSVIDDQDEAAGVELEPALAVEEVRVAGCLRAPRGRP